MLKQLMKTGAALFLLCSLQSVYAHKATEIYIPLGQSPGLSGVYTTLGNITSVNMAEKTLYMSDADGIYTVKITASTKVWLDQSQLKLKNRTASMQDMQQGMLAEVKYTNNEKGGTVEWVKIQRVKP